MCERARTLKRGVLSPLLVVVLANQQVRTAACTRHEHPARPATAAAPSPVVSHVGHEKKRSRDACPYVCPPPPFSCPSFWFSSRHPMARASAHVRRRLGFEGRPRHHVRLFGLLAHAIHVSVDLVDRALERMNALLVLSQRRGGLRAAAEVSVRHQRHSGLRYPDARKKKSTPRQTWILSARKVTRPKSPTSSHRAAGRTQRRPKRGS